MSNSRYSWGDTVQVVPNAPGHFRPGAVAEVCGIRTLAHSQEGMTNIVDIQSVGHILYLIEFGDGYTTELPEELLMEARLSLNQDIGACD